MSNVSDVLINYGMSRLVHYIENPSVSIYRDLLLDTFAKSRTQPAGVRMMGESPIVYVCAGISSLLFGICQGYNRYWMSTEHLENHVHLLLKADPVTEPTSDFVDILLSSLHELDLLGFKSRLELDYQQAQSRFPGLDEKVYNHRQKTGLNEFADLEPRSRTEAFLNDLLVALGHRLPALGVCQKQLSELSSFITDPNFTYPRAMHAAIMPERKHYFQKKECRLVSLSLDSPRHQLESETWSDLLEKYEVLKLYDDSNYPTFIGFVKLEPGGFRYFYANEEEKDSHSVDGSFTVLKVLDIRRDAKV